MSDLCCGDVLTLVGDTHADLPPGSYTLLSDPDVSPVMLGMAGEDEDGELFTTDRRFSIEASDLAAFRFDGLTLGWSG